MAILVCRKDAASSYEYPIPLGETVECLVCYKPCWRDVTDARAQDELAIRIVGKVEFICHVCLPIYALEDFQLFKDKRN